MANVKRYVYQLSLSDGTVLINESEGLFSIKSQDNPDDKVLINSAVLIKVLDMPEEVESVVLDPQTMQPVVDVPAELNEDVPVEGNEVNDQA